MNLNPFALLAKTFRKPTAVAAAPVEHSFIVPAARSRWMGAGVAQYTPQRVEQVFRMALAGDLDSQWEMFDLMEATWPRLSKNLNELKDSVCSMTYTVQPWARKGEDPSPEAEARASLVEELIWNMKPDPTADENDLEDTMRDLMDARGKGISILEIDWGTGATANGHAIAPRATRWIHPNNYGFTNSGRLMLKSGRRGAENFVEFPPNKFLIGICKNKTGHPLGSAMLHVLGFYWAAANFTAEWYLNFCQVFGQPMRWATYDPNMSGADKAKLDNMLANMGSAAWASFPSGTQMELKEAASGQGNPQLAMLALADKVCDLVVLRQTLTSDVSADGGARALGEVHERVLGGVQLSCAKWTAKTLQQLVRAICILNYGDDSECPYLVPSVADEGDGKRLSDQLLVLASAGLEPEDDELPALSERIGFGVQRKALPEPQGFGGYGGGGFQREASSPRPSPSEGEGGGTPGEDSVARTQVDTKGLNARAHSTAREARALPPSDAIAAKKAKALGEIYRGSMAPFRQIVLNSTSKEEALQKLEAAYADWKPDRLTSELEIALQICAAAGAGDAARGETLTALSAADAEGKWVTVNGSPILIKEGETVESAMKEKFGKNESEKGGIDELKKMLPSTQKSFETAPPEVEKKLISKIKSTHSRMDEVVGDFAESGKTPEDYDKFTAKVKSLKTDFESESDGKTKFSMDVDHSSGGHGKGFSESTYVVYDVTRDDDGESYFNTDTVRYSRHGERK